MGNRRYNQIGHILEKREWNTMGIPMENGKEMEILGEVEQK